VSSLNKLFSPVSIGSMEVKNRLVMAPITTNYGNDKQEPSERMFAYHAARAKGGVGLITVEVCSVDIQHRYQMNSLSLADDRFIPLHKALTDNIHQHGAKCQPQITHPGPESMSMWIENTPALGPSPVCGLGNRPPCKELTIEEIEKIIEQYAQAARRAKEAGYDGMELHAAHAYMLLASFLSPWRNKRRDEYGRRSGRHRLLLEVIQRMKESTGGDFPLTLRISGFERLKGGREINDTQELAPLLVEAGVDAFHLTGGWAGDHEASMTICGSEFQYGYNVAAAQALKNVVDVPVMVVGRIHDPQHAEQVLAEGHADMIVMGRPMLADPELPNKAKAGRFDEVRRCISCQNCVDTLIINDMNCAVNACSGRELKFNLDPTPNPKHVLVVGGGTAGMEAARVAAVKGHRVTLCERHHKLGGSLTLASTVHSDNELLLKFLLQQMKTLPIDLRLGQEVNEAFIQQVKPDSIIVATGARVAVSDIEGDNLNHVLKGPQLRALLVGDIDPDNLQASTQGLPAWLAGAIKLARPGLPVISKFLQKIISPKRLREVTKYWLPLGKKVVVVGADLAATELAEFLAVRGREVTLLEESDRIAPEVGVRRRSDHMDGLDKKSVVVNTAVKISCITESGIEIENRLGQKHSIKADNIILAGSPVAETGLFEQLQTIHPDVKAIGDCTGLGLIAGATTDALEAICELDKAV